MPMNQQEKKIKVAELMKIIENSLSSSSSSSSDTGVPQNLENIEEWKGIQKILNKIEIFEDKIAVLKALLQSNGLTEWVKTNNNPNKIPLLRAFVIEIKLSQQTLNTHNKNPVLSEEIKQSLKTALMTNLSTYSNLNARRSAKIGGMAAPLFPFGTVGSIFMFGAALGEITGPLWEKNRQIHQEFIEALVEKLSEILASEKIHEYWLSSTASLEVIESEPKHALWLRAIEHFYINGHIDDHPDLFHHTSIWIGQCKLAIRDVIFQQAADIQLAYYRKIIGMTIKNDSGSTIAFTLLGQFMTVTRDPIAYNDFRGRASRLIGYHYDSSPEFGKRGVCKDIYKWIKKAEDVCINDYLTASSDEISAEICAVLRPAARQKSPTNTAPSHTLLPPVNTNNLPAERHDNDLVSDVVTNRQL